VDAARRVELILGGRGEQAVALREGRADVALLPLPFDDRDFDVEPLLTEPRLVALAADDPLAARTSLSLRDLTGRVLPDGSPAEHEASRPTSPPSTRLDLAQIFTLVETGSIVLFLPVSLAQRHPRPNIAYRAVTDLAPSTLALAWPRDSHSPAIAAFVRAAMTIARDVLESDELSPRSTTSAG
jgi:DNA-binding transcriptional LysR family regulator